MKKARSAGDHDFYHLLSGVDLPLKPIKEINEFYACNKEKIFLSYTTKECCIKHYKMRLKYKHYFRERCGRDKNIYTIFNKIGVLIQKPFVRRGPINVDDFYFGSAWFDLPQDVLDKVIKKEPEIQKLYRYGSCCDEAFLQSMIWNDKMLRSRLYVPELNNGQRGNMRWIDMDRGINAGAYVIRPEDVDGILESGMMFARKFDYDKYPETVKVVLSSIQKETAK